MIEGLIAIALVFMRIGLLAFGGGLSILPEMERSVVETHGWMTHQEFVDTYALSQMTPGPGMLMVVMIGDRAAGLWGGAVAGLAMFVPTGAISWLVADRWSRLNDRPILVAVRATLAPVALGLLAAGTYALFQLAVHGPATLVFALLAFVAIMRFSVSPMIIVSAAAVVGLLVLR